MGFQKGENHPRYRGGVETRGSLAWAANRLANAKRKAAKLGYTPAAITAEEFVARYQKHGHVCDTCGAPEDNSKFGLHLEHDHLTGRVRGFVCFRCNLIISAVEKLNQNARLRKSINDFLQT